MPKKKEVDLTKNPESKRGELERQHPWLAKNIVYLRVTGVCLGVIFFSAVIWLISQVNQSSHVPFL
jgi:hypothetical protein